MTTYPHNREFQFYNCNLPRVVTAPKIKKGVENNYNRGYYWRIYGILKILIEGHYNHFNDFFNIFTIIALYSKDH